MAHPQPARIVCLANPTGLYAQVRLPPGDVLLCAGSLTASGYSAELLDFATWLAAQPHPLKVVVPGDRDHAARADPARFQELIGDAAGLAEGGAEAGGLRVWGIAYHPRWPGIRDGAFAVDADEARDRWERVPAELDVLVSQWPPLGSLDDLGDGRRAGCPLAARHAKRSPPRLHVFGGEGCRRGARFVDGRVQLNASALPDLQAVVLHLSSSGDAPQTPSGS